MVKNGALAIATVMTVTLTCDHRVVDGTDYPATMFVAFDNDTRTDPMHARKMCAAVQHATSSERPVVEE